LNVTHACSAKTLIYWKLPSDVDGNEIIDIFDIGSKCSLVSWTTYWTIRI